MNAAPTAQVHAHMPPHVHPHGHPPPSGVPAVAPRQAAARAPAQRSGFVPMLLLAFGINGWLGFQSVQLLAERQQLAGAQAALDTQAQGAAKVRAALDALATATAKLAAEGNANARAIVEQLRQRGITINTPASPGALAKPP